MIETVLHVSIIVCCAFLFASLASFLGVVAERSIAGESIGGRSSCSCGRQLLWHENVPVIGWLRARGVAPCCQTRIPRFLVITESIAAVAGAGVGMVFFNRLSNEGASSAPLLLAVSIAFSILMVELIVMHRFASKRSDLHA